MLPSEDTDYIHYTPPSRQTTTQPPKLKSLKNNFGYSHATYACDLSLVGFAKQNFFQQVYM